MLGFTTESTFKIRLPAGDESTYFLNIVVHIRDKIDCVKEYDMDPVIVVPDLQEINNLIEMVQEPKHEETKGPFVHALASTDQNRIIQIIILLAKELNKMNQQNIRDSIMSTFFIHFPL